MIQKRASMECTFTKYITIIHTICLRCKIIFIFHHYSSKSIRFVMGKKSLKIGYVIDKKKKKHVMYKNSKTAKFYGCKRASEKCTCR